MNPFTTRTILALVLLVFGLSNCSSKKEEKSSSKKPTAVAVEEGDLEQEATGSNRNDDDDFTDDDSAKSKSDVDGDLDKNDDDDDANNSSNNKNDDDDLEKCPAGYYCKKSTDLDSAKLCTAGFFCPEGSTLPTGDGQCDAGYFCPEGSKKADQFPSGKGFFTRKGFTEPEECSTGYYCPEDSNSEPLECDNGPDFSEYTQVMETKKECSYRCIDGYVKINDKCELPVADDPPPPPIPPDTGYLIVKASGLSYGSAQDVCVNGGKPSYVSATPLRSFSSACRGYVRGSVGYCTGFNQSSFTTSFVSVCRCNFVCPYPR